MHDGKLNIYTKMERKMLSDIRDLRKKKINVLENLEVKQMKRTAELVKLSKVL